MICWKAKSPLHDPMYSNSFSSKGDDDGGFGASTTSPAGLNERPFNNLTLTTKMPTDENASRSFVYNSEAPTILINNYTRAAHSSVHNKMDANGIGGGNVGGNNVKKSSITIYTHNSDSDGQIKIMINLDRPPMKQQEYDKEKAGASIAATKTSSSSVSVATAKPTTTTATNTTTTITNPKGLAKSPAAICPITKIKKEKIDIDDLDVGVRNVDSNSIGTTDAYRSNQYAVGDDVFIMDTDDRFYLGTIKTITHSKCLVRFDDGSERFAMFDELRKLDVPKWQQPTCISCKHNNDQTKTVLVCRRCCRGYHKECCAGSTDANGQWFCTRCDIEIKHRQNENSATECLVNDTDADNSYNPMPYDWRSLTWFNNHRENKQRKYCYCGNNGKWFMQMLQCARCLQWFHHGCTKSLTYPLYFGDRFYLFACANCNHGEEFVRRLEMKIEDVVHLLLFNLSIYTKKRYYSIPDVIVPYVKDNWHALQLPPKLKSMLFSDIRDEVKRALKNHTMRFKSSKRQLTELARLKVRAPPNAPVIALPPGPPLSEKYLNDLFCDQARIHFLPREICDNVANDAKMQNLMRGKNYMDSIHQCDNESFSSDNESGENVITSASDDEVLADMVMRTNGTNQRLKDSHPSTRDFDDSLMLNNSSDYSVSGFEGFTANEADKKKSVFSFSSAANMGRRDRYRGKTERRPVELYDSSDDTSSRGTLDAIIPPPKDFRGRNNPFLDHGSSSAATQTSTPKNNANGSGHPSLGFSGALSGNSAAAVASGSGVRPENRVRMVRTIKRRLSAKDIHIGPNMEVKRRKVKRRAEQIEVISTIPLQDLPKSNAFLPIRGDSKNISMTAIRSSLFSNKPSSIHSINGLNDVRRPHHSNVDCVPSKSALPTTSMVSSTSLSSIPGSPIKSENQDVTIANLQSTVNQYFGAANRIASGENFVVKGKRTSMDGRIQYLIEWDVV